MSKSPRPGAHRFLGLFIGGFCGALWWAAYAQSVPYLGVLVLSHALAGWALQLTSGFVAKRWRPPEAVVGGALGAFVLAPLVLVTPYAFGHITGLKGLSVIVVVMGCGALLGLESGSRLRLGWAVIGLAAAIVAFTNTRLMSRRETPEPIRAQRVTSSFPEAHVAVIGIDGADLSVVVPMVERGELPNLAGLLSRGQHGVLRSLSGSATLSPIAWTTAFSGQLPERHGIRSWATSDNRNRKEPLLWDIFAAHGHTSVVVNVPGSWPPAPIQGGSVISGFPIPTLDRGRQGQLLGSVVSTEEDDRGPVSTFRAEPNGDGGFSLDFPIATPAMRPRIRGFLHPLLVAGEKEGLLPVRPERFVATATVDGTRVRLTSEALTEPAELEVDAWSQWLEVRFSEEAAYWRIFVLEANAERLRLFVTPAFQDPIEPRYPFTTGVATSILSGLDSPYVVEGIGWRAHRDLRVAALLPELLTNVEQVHAATVVELLHKRRPLLLAYVITVTDRIQHPFWRLHAPSLYPTHLPPHPGLEGRDPVAEAYRLSDTLVGRILEALPEETLVFVVSDHGSAPDLEQGEGTHRLEGLWIAAGPGVSHEDAPHELSILDLVPTVLLCIGAPTAEDMPGHASGRVCSQPAPERRVRSYSDRGSGALHESETLIDSTREKQLRSLGYLD